MFDATPRFQFAFGIESKVQVFAMWRRRNRRANSDTCANMRPVNPVTHAQTEGHLRATFENPVDVTAFARFCNDIGFAELSERLIVRIGTDTLVPIDVRVNFGAVRARRERNGQQQQRQRS